MELSSSPVPTSHKQKFDQSFENAASQKRCPECGQEEASKAELEAHLGSFHPNLVVAILDGQQSSQPYRLKKTRVKHEPEPSSTTSDSKSDNVSNPAKPSSVSAAVGSPRAGSPASDSNSRRSPSKRRLSFDEAGSEQASKLRSAPGSGGPRLNPSLARSEDADAIAAKAESDRASPLSRDGVLGGGYTYISHVTKGGPIRVKKALSPAVHQVGPLPRLPLTAANLLSSSIKPHPPRGPIDSRPPGILNLRYKSEWPTLALQPQSRPVFQEHLAAEVKSIYTGLTQVETKCVHLDKLQLATPRSESRITDDHWQAMTALHRTLLHEHHDFFLASQHPSASAALKRLAVKYSMPARMWKHGIHSYLELLRNRLPESLEYMLAFIYLAYQMIALLYETVPTFRNTWIECLGDLGRYRMAVEDENVKDREVWAGTARGWYNKAADTNPAIGRLFHHLAILARPNMLQQLYLYNRSLTSVIPFMNARESIVTIFDPIVNQLSSPGMEAFEFNLLKIHALLFRKSDFQSLRPLLNTLVSEAAGHVSRLGDRWLLVGAYIAIANNAPLFDFGTENNRFRFIFDYRRKAIQMQDPKLISHGLPDDQSLPPAHSIPPIDIESEKAMLYAIDLYCETLKVVLSQPYTPYLLGFVHCCCVFLLHLQQMTDPSFASTTAPLLQKVPWDALAAFMNTILIAEEHVNPAFVDTIVFDHDNRPLAEDWLLRGVSPAFNYLPRAHFKDAAIIEEEERYMERTSRHRSRVDRVLSLGVQLTKTGTYMRFSPARRAFAVRREDARMSDDDDEGYFSITTDNPLMLQIEKEERQKELNGSMPDSPTDLVTIQREYDSMIVDCGVIRQPSSFQKLLKMNIPIVVLREGVEELLEDKDYVKGVDALEVLSNALIDRDDVSIKGSNGEDVTKEFKAHLPQSIETLKKSQNRDIIPYGYSKAHMEMMINFIRHETSSTVSTTRSNTAMTTVSSANTMDTTTTVTEPDKNIATQASEAQQQAKPMTRKSLLVTDNKALRIKADKTLGSAAIASVTISKLLNGARRLNESKNATAAKSAASIIAAAATAAAASEASSVMDVDRDASRAPATPVGET